MSSRRSWVSIDAGNSRIKWAFATLAIGNGDGELGVWNTSSLNRLWQRPMTRTATGIAFSPQSDLLALCTGHIDKWTGEPTSAQVQLVDARTGALRRILWFPGPAIKSVAFSTDGHYVAGLRNSYGHHAPNI